MKIEDLFFSRLSKADSVAPSGLWEKLESGLEAELPQSSGGDSAIDPSVAGSAKFFSVLAKTLIGIAGISALAVGGYFLLTDDQTPQTPTQTMVSNPPITEPTAQEVEIPVENTITEEPIAISNFQDTVSYIASSPMVEPSKDTIISEHEISTPIVESQVVKTTCAPVEEVEQTSVAPNPPEQIQKQAESMAETVIPIEETKIEIGIPNVITPNGDGINDRFEIHKLEHYPDNQLVILDRRGKVVFSARSYNNDWSSEGLPNGTYFYRLSVKQGSNTKIFKGSITVLR